MEKTVFSVQDLADRWSYHPNTIRQMEAEGKLHRLPELPQVRYSIKEVIQLESVGLDAEPLTAWERKQKDEKIANLEYKLAKAEERLAKVALIAQGLGGTS